MSGFYAGIFDRLLEISPVIEREKIVVWGAGKTGRIVGSILQTLDISIAYFVDGDLSRNGMKIFDTDVCLPQQLMEEKERVVVLIASIHHKEIRTQIHLLNHEVDVYSVLPPDHRQLPDFYKSPTYLKEYGFHVGKYTYGYQQFCYSYAKSNRIGSFTSIAKNVILADFNHPLKYITTHPLFYERRFGFVEEDDEVLQGLEKNRKVDIGHDVWIGAGVKILPSVSIGNGAVIGTGAVVTKDVPSYSIVVGCPAKVMRYRFEPNQIELINRSAWWDWDDDKIKKKMNSFLNNDQFFEYIMKNY